MRPGMTFTLVCFGAGCFLTLLLAYIHLPYRIYDGRTEFAPGYSETLFQMIHPGMTREQVRARLGEPLMIEPRPELRQWIYLPDDHALAPQRPGAAKPARRRWMSEWTAVGFGEDWRARLVVGDYLPEWSVRGRSVHEIMNRHRMPAFTLTRPAAVIESYSRPAGSGAWKVLRVWMTPVGEVMAVEAFTHYSPTRLLPSVTPFTFEIPAPGLVPPFWPRRIAWPVAPGWAPPEVVIDQRPPAA